MTTENNEIEIYQREIKKSDKATIKCKKIGNYVLGNDKHNNS